MQVLSLPEAGQRSGVSMRWLQHEIKAKRLAVIHLGKRRIGILDSDLEAWVLERREPAIEVGTFGSGAATFGCGSLSVPAFKEEGAV